MLNISFVEASAMSVVDQFQTLASTSEVDDMSREISRHNWDWR